MKLSEMTIFLEYAKKKKKKNANEILIVRVVVFKFKGL